MVEPLQRVPRPTSDDGLEPSASRGISRSHLTLYLSIAAIVLSIASAGVNLFVFLAAGQRKTVNEADQIQLQASANRVLQELAVDPKSHPILNDELTKLYKRLVYRPPFNTQLTVYERAAFGLVVQSYAIPLEDAQLRSVQSRENLYINGVRDNIKGRMLSFQELECFTDPFLYDCPAVPGFTGEKTPEEKK